MEKGALPLPTLRLEPPIAKRRVPPNRADMILRLAVHPPSRARAALVVQQGTGGPELTRAALEQAVAVVADVHLGAAPHGPVVAVRVDHARGAVVVDAARGLLQVGLPVARQVAVRAVDVGLVDAVGHLA